MADSQRLEYLFGMCLDAKASNEERQEFISLLQQPQNEALAKELLQRAFAESKPLTDTSPETATSILEAILAVDKNGKAKVVPLRPIRRAVYRWWVAAAVFALIVSGTYYLLNKKQKPEIASTHAGHIFKNDVAPGGNKAILILGNGQKIILDSVHLGTIANEGKTNITKTGNGKLSYSPSTGGGGGEALYNTLSTPRGGQYQLELPDGSRVWLNAASSITYPTSFTGRERIVEITGEAYFEVVHNEKIPFKVKAGDQLIEDIGTAFNVNAYTNEPARKTTLIEGAVKIAYHDEIQTLRPGQQSVIEKNQMVVVDHADTESAVAWKNGYFHFRDASLEDLMRQIARWYDVEIEYRGTIPERKFGGEISRHNNASEVLKILELSKVNFEIEGKKIIVMP